MTSIVSVQPEKETIEKEKFFFSQHILMQFDPARPKKNKIRFIKRSKDGANNVDFYFSSLFPITEGGNNFLKN